MEGQTKKRGFKFWRFARRIVLALLLMVVAAVVFLHLVGVPGSVIKRFIPPLKGYSIEIDSAHLENWTTVHLRGVILSTTNGPGTHITLSSLKVGISKLDDGKYWATFIIPQSASVSLGNSPSTEATLRLGSARLNGSYQWDSQTLGLDNLALRWNGLEIITRGSLDNSLAITNWSIFQKRPKTGKKINWDAILTQLNGFEFSPGSQCIITFSGDAEAETNVQVEVNLQSAEVITPVGRIRQLSASGAITNLGETDMGKLIFTAGRYEHEELIANNIQSTGELLAGGETNEFSIELQAALESLFYSRLSTTNVTANAKLSFTGNQPSAMEAKLSSAHFQIPGNFAGSNFTIFANSQITNGRAYNIALKAATANLGAITKEWVVPSIQVAGHSSGETFFPFNITINATNAKANSGSAGEIKVTASVQTNSAAAHYQNIGLWTNALPYIANFDIALAKVEARGMKVASFGAQGSWTAPMLELTNFQGKVSDCTVSGKVSLNVPGRAIEIHSYSDFDPLLALPVLPSYGQKWLKQFGWETPPKINAVLGMRLPAWTNSNPNWAKAVLPTVAINGNFTSGPGSFREIPVSAAKGSFSYTNLTWIIPNIHAERPEGHLILGYEGNNHIGNYYFNIDSYFNLKPLRPVLPESHQKVLDELSFQKPPHVKGEVFGKWQKYDQIKFNGTVEATNATFRGVKLNSVTGTAYYTNFTLYLTNVHLTQTNRSLLLLEGGVDFQNGTGYVSRATNNLDPYPLARAIHPQAYKAIEPYQFASPPDVIARGNFGFSGLKDLNFDFNVKGNNFTWDRLKADAVAGNIVWRGRSLVITNINAAAYKGGLIAGAANFYFPPERDGADFQFDFSYKDVDLQSLINVWTGNTNKLEGIIEGQLEITKADASDFKSWNGQGWAKLTDGLIWEIPIFGIFSPLFEAIVPGLGKSKAREGSATFIITNSVVYSDDLEVRSPALRMRYSGTSDFDQNINAVVEAEILRDTWAVGRALSWIFSPVTKLLKFEVTGKLGDPKAEPVHIPRAIMFALRPFKSIKDLLTLDKPEPASETP